ncbi:unnamed protein product [Urochloa humidicola]
MADKAGAAHGGDGCGRRRARAQEAGGNLATATPLPATCLTKCQKSLRWSCGCRWGTTINSNVQVVKSKNSSCQAKAKEKQ